MSPEEALDDHLANIPAKDAAALRKVYGKQLDTVVKSEHEIVDQEPQTGPCCAEEGS